MEVSLIVAASQNGVIGKENKLPWHLPADLRHFKDLTMGHPILMGRKTYESIGKPLPGRTNIVITRQPNFSCCGVLVANSLQHALEICDHRGTAKQSKEMVAPPLSADHGADEEVFVIGGAQIFEQAMPLANKLYLTLIHQDFEGDTFFKWEKAGWEEVARQDHAGLPPYSFIQLRKR